MSNVLLCYVAGKYSDDRGQWYVDQHIQLARQVARELWKMGSGGLGVICPHSNTAYMDGSGLSWEDFMAGDFEMIRRCDFLVLLPNWRNSRGAREEYDLAKSLDKEVFLWGDRRDMERLGLLMKTLEPAGVE